jgi:predicted LPLAT superfamily acyltransferase
VNNREKPIERLLHVIEDRIEEWRAKMSAREVELRAHREMLLAEAAERGRLLALAASEKGDSERSLEEEAAKEHRVAFIVHSEGCPHQRRLACVRVAPAGGCS